MSKRTIIAIALLLMAGWSSSTSEEFSNKAILLNAGKYSYNYRMEISVHSFYNMLQTLGFDDSDVLYVNGDTLICNPNMINCPSLRNVPDKEEGSVLKGAYENDVSLRDLNPTSFVELMSGRHHPRETHFRRLERDENTNFFFQSTGHGGNLYLKIQDVAVVFAQEIADYMKDPAMRLKHRESFVVNDSCSAVTVFSRMSDEKNFFLLGSSGWDEKSLSHDNDDIYTTPLNDQYPHYFMRDIAGDLIDNKYISFHNYTSTINKSLEKFKLDWHNQLSKSDKLSYINDFLVQREARIVETVRPKSRPVQQLLNGFFN
jgi:glycosylphosphatidylinositol transamidase (GPIT) subunit GPI8